MPGAARARDSASWRACSPRSGSPSSSAPVDGEVIHDEHVGLSGSSLELLPGHLPAQNHAGHHLARFPAGAQARPGPCHPGHGPQRGLERLQVPDLALGPRAPGQRAPEHQLATGTKGAEGRCGALADEHLAADAEGAELSRAVPHRERFVPERSCRACRACQKTLADRGGEGQSPAPRKQPVPLLCRQEWQSRERGLRGLQGSLQQRRELGGEPHHRGRVEQRAGVREIPGERLSAAPQVQPQVEVVHLAAQLERRERDAPQRQPIQRLGVQGEHGVEQGIAVGAAHPAQALHQHLEGQRLPAMGGPRRGAQPGHQLLERGIPRRIHPDRRHLGEIANQRRRLGALAVGERRPHREGALGAPLVPTVAREQRGKCRQKDDERRGAQPPSELGHAPSSRLREAEERHLAEEPRGSSAGAITGQRDPPEARELVLGRVEQRRAGGGGEGARLVHGHVAVLQAEGRQARRESRAASPVEDRQLLHEEPDRPAVPDQVVGDHQQHVIPVAEAVEHGLEGLTAGELERPARLFFGPGDGPRQGSLRAWQRAVHLAEIQRSGGHHPLARRALALAERGAQDLVTGHDVPRGRARSAGEVEGPAQAHGGGQVEDAAVSGELAGEPGAPLRVGEREIGLARVPRRDGAPAHGSGHPQKEGAALFPGARRGLTLHHRLHTPGSRTGLDATVWGTRLRDGIGERKGHCRAGRRTLSPRSADRRDRARQ
jgi:hypothetical protein